MLRGGAILDHCFGRVFQQQSREPASLPRGKYDVPYAVFIRLQGWMVYDHLVPIVPPYF
jgi:hypothetical protein